MLYTALGAFVGVLAAWAVVYFFTRKRNTVAESVRKEEPKNAQLPPPMLAPSDPMCSAFAWMLEEHAIKQYPKADLRAMNIKDPMIEAQRSFDRLKTLLDRKDFSTLEMTNEAVNAASNLMIAVIVSQIL